MARNNSRWQPRSQRRRPEYQSFDEVERELGGSYSGTAVPEKEVAEARRSKLRCSLCGEWIPIGDLHARTIHDRFHGIGADRLFELRDAHRKDTGFGDQHDLES